MNTDLDRKLRTSVVYLSRLILMSLFAVFITLPFFWIIPTGFKPMDRVFADLSPFSIKAFVPSPFTVEPLITLFKGGFAQSIFITILVAVATIAAGILVNSMAGFSFARFDFPAKRLLFIMVIMSFLIPFEAVVVPLFLTIQALGWLNTIMALVLPLVANGLCIFLFRQFYLGIPQDLVDAALVDGSSWVRIYWNVFVPISAPAAIIAGMLLFLSQWQSFFWPLLAAKTESLRMMQVSIAYLTRSEHEVFWNRIAVASFITAIVPLFMIFPLQRYFVRGITTSGLKA